MRNFWKILDKNAKKKGRGILGLSPMDGVTDAPMRKLIAQTSNPDVIMTEFVNVEGLARGAIKMLEDFEYDECERPVLAQIYGTEIDSFYGVAFIVCELGFDGVDINMGCPAKKVAHRGAGAGLIDAPEHAKKVIQSVKKAVSDFASGMTMEEAGIRPKVINRVREMQKKHSQCDFKKPAEERDLIPVSVKTRMGTAEIVADKWIDHLLSQDIQAISLHGRTLNQGYSGEANWEIIAQAGKIVSDHNKKPENSHNQVVFLGNGDLESFSHAQKRIHQSGVSGALIGRATFGNPWIFLENTPLENPEISDEEKEDIRKKKCLEHCELFEEIFPNRPFFIMRKHLGWYMKHFSGSRELRKKLMLANSSAEVKDILGF